VGVYSGAGKIYTTTAYTIEANITIGTSAVGDTIGGFDAYCIYTVLPSTIPS
jgi:hypothetical protein